MPDEAIANALGGTHFKSKLQRIFIDKLPRNRRSY